MTPTEIARRLRALGIEANTLADEIERQETPSQPWPEFPEEVEYPAGNPYPYSSAMIPLTPDDHLTPDPKIFDNTLGSRYWRLLWDIADRAKVELVIMRGQHPDGCVDVAYPKINGALDKAAMGRIIQAFLDVCVPLPDKSTNETEIRMGGDVWPLVANRHIQIDNERGHRFDDPLYPHFHLRLGVP